LGTATCTIPRAFSIIFWRRLLILAQVPDSRGNSQTPKANPRKKAVVAIRSDLLWAPLKDLVAKVDCFCHQEPERLCDSDRGFPKRPTKSKPSKPTGRRRFGGPIHYRRLIRSAPTKSLIRQIYLLEPVLRFLLKPDVIRESIGMPYFRLITVCLSYLFERRPRLNLKDLTIIVVIAHRIRGFSLLFPAEFVLWNCGSGRGEEH
jgi:hypothetical protein